MAATDARPIPKKNVAYRVTFPILDADGDLVTGATALDSEVSIDGAAFADATAEATEIATASGMYFLDLTAGEMNGDTIAIIVKTSSAGAKTTPIVLYPEEAGDIRVDVTSWLGTAAATPTVAGVPEVDVTHWIGTAAATPTVAGVPEVDITHFNGTAGTFAAGRPEVNTSHVGGTLQTAGDIMADTNDIQARLPAALVGGRIDASVGAVAANAITAASLAADASTEIRSLASGTADSGTTTTMVDAARTEADTDYWKGCILVITSGTLLGQSRNISAFNAATDTITVDRAFTQAIGTHTYEIWPAVDTAALAAAVDAVDNFVDTEITDIQNRLPAALVSGRMDASVGAMAADVVTAAAVAANAIGASELAADAATEVAAAVWDKARADHTTAGTFGQGAASVQGNVTGSVGSVTGAVGSVTAGVTLAASAVQAIWDALTSALTTVGSIGKRLADNIDVVVSTRATPAQVNTEVVDALNVDTYAEPAQGAPAATATLAAKINYLYKNWRNRKTQTSTTWSLYNDDAVTVDHKATVADDGTTASKTEIATGP